MLRMASHWLCVGLQPCMGWEQQLLFEGQVSDWCGSLHLMSGTSLPQHQQGQPDWKGRHERWPPRWAYGWYRDTREALTNPSRCEQPIFPLLWHHCLGVLSLWVSSIDYCTFRPTVSVVRRPQELILRSKNLKWTFHAMGPLRAIP